VLGFYKIYFPFSTSFDGMYTIYAGLMPSEESI